VLVVCVTIVNLFYYFAAASKGLITACKAIIVVTKLLEIMFLSHFVLHLCFRNGENEYSKEKVKKKEKGGI